MHMANDHICYMLLGAATWYGYIKLFEYESKYRLLMHVIYV